MNEETKESTYNHVPPNKGKIIGVKDTSKSMRITVGVGILYYILYFVLLLFIGLTFYFLLAQNFSQVVFPAAFIVLITIVLVQQKRRLFLRVSYPKENVIRINSEDYNYKEEDIRILIVGIKSQMAIAKYDYYIKILKSQESIFSAKVNYVREGKIEWFIDNLIFAQSE